MRALDDLAVMVPADGLGAGPGSAGGAGLEDLLSGADAESMLVDGLLRHMLRMSARSTRAAVFLMSMGLEKELRFILEMRKHQQSPGEIRKSLEAVALKKFMGQVNVSLGGK